MFSEWHFHSWTFFSWCVLATTNQKWNNVFLFFGWQIMVDSYQASKQCWWHNIIELNELKIQVANIIIIIINKLYLKLKNWKWNSFFFFIFFIAEFVTDKPLSSSSLWWRWNDNDNILKIDFFSFEKIDSREKKSLNNGEFLWRNHDHHYVLSLEHNKIEIYDFFQWKFSIEFQQYNDNNKSFWN